MPSKKQPKHAEGHYHRVADDIRKKAAASEKKIKPRPRVAPSLAEDGARTPQGPPLALSPGLQRQASSFSPAMSGVASPGPSSPMLRVLSPGGGRSPATAASPMPGAASPRVGKLTPIASMSSLGNMSPAVRSTTLTPSRTPKGRAKTSKGVTLVAFLGSVALLAIAVTAGIAAVIFFRRKPGVVCKTPGCRRYSEALLASMNSSVDPCQDFGRYVCGRYSHPSGLSVAEVMPD